MEKKTTSHWFTSSHPDKVKAFPYVPNTKEAKDLRSSTDPQKLREDYIEYKNVNGNAVAFWKPVDGKDQVKNFTKVKECYLYDLYRDITASPSLLKSLPHSGIGDDGKPIVDYRILIEGNVKQTGAKGAKGESKSSKQSNGKSSSSKKSSGDDNPFDFTGNIDPDHWLNYASVIGKPDPDSILSKDLIDMAVNFPDGIFLPMYTIQTLIVIGPNKLSHFTPDRLKFIPDSADNRPGDAKISDKRTAEESVSNGHAEPEKSSKKSKPREETKPPPLEKKEPKPEVRVKEEPDKAPEPKKEVDPYADFVPNIISHAWRNIEDGRSDVISTDLGKADLEKEKEDSILCLIKPKKGKNPSIKKIESRVKRLGKEKLELTYALFDMFLDSYDQKKFSKEVRYKSNTDGLTNYYALGHKMNPEKGYIPDNKDVVTKSTRTSDEAKGQRKFEGIMQLYRGDVFTAFMNVFLKMDPPTSPEIKEFSEALKQRVANDLFNKNARWIIAIFDYLFPMETFDD